MCNIFNYHNFDEVFEFDPDCAYDEDNIPTIEQNRRDLEGLFIDRVMKALGIKRPTKYYPPKTNGDLRNLHKAIVESGGNADTPKLSVLYYILLEFDFPTGERNFSTALERSAFLPAKYSIYMKGLWHLDRQEYERALEYLTHPSLTPTFADEILEVLVRRSKDLTLALAYYHTVQPALTTRQSIECLFSAIGRTSVTEAFYFCRGQPELAQRHLFEILISVVLHNSSSDTIAQRSVELVNLPFTKEEEMWFEDYLLNGEGQGLKKAKDTVMMRKIGTGQFTESLELRGIHGRRIGGLDWNKLSDAVENGLGPRVGI